MLHLFSIVPNQPPTNMTMTSTLYSIEVSWNHLENRTDPNFVNGNYYMYYVYYRRIDSTEPWDNIGTKNNTVLIRDLLPATLYGIRVLASVVEGNGIASPEEQISTKESGKRMFLIIRLYFLFLT